MDAQTLAMIAIAIHLIIVSLYGLLLALFSYLLDFCFWRGNVFQFYLPLLAKVIAKQINPVKCENALLIQDKEKRTDALFDIVEGNGLFKMLGGCIVCLNIWIGFATFPFIHALAGHSYWYMIPYVLTASFFLRKIVKVD